jgi:glutamate dehydrogenase/leucine dehydrogenase
MASRMGSNKRRRGEEVGRRGRRVGTMTGEVGTMTGEVAMSVVTGSSMMLGMAAVEVATMEAISGCCSRCSEIS